MYEKIICDFDSQGVSQASVFLKQALLISIKYNSIKIYFFIE